MIYDVLIAFLGGAFTAALKVVFSQIKGIKLGVKALLRAQMIRDSRRIRGSGNDSKCRKPYNLYH